MAGGYENKEMDLRDVTEAGFGNQLIKCEEQGKLKHKTNKKK